jgi:hypothetical protein
VKHLLAIVREHRASSRRIGSPLDERALRAVFDALRVESLGGDPRALLQHPDPVAAWLRQALFEDLLEVPGTLRMAEPDRRDLLRKLEDRESGS